jgi:hypothetical protein
LSPLSVRTPGRRNKNRYNPGWVWAEATGKNNPLGWVPKKLTGVKLAA